MHMQYTCSTHAVYLQRLEHGCRGPQLPHGAQQVELEPRSGQPRHVRRAPLGCGLGGRAVLPQLLLLHHLLVEGEPQLHDLLLSLLRRHDAPLLFVRRHRPQLHVRRLELPREIGREIGLHRGARRRGRGSDRLAGSGRWLGLERGRGRGCRRGRGRRRRRRRRRRRGRRRGRDRRRGRRRDRRRGRRRERGRRRGRGRSGRRRPLLHGGSSGCGGRRLLEEDPRVYGAGGLVGAELEHVAREVAVHLVVYLEVDHGAVDLGVGGRARNRRFQPAFTAVPQLSGSSRVRGAARSLASQPQEARVASRGTARTGHSQPAGLPSSTCRRWPSR